MPPRRVQAQRGATPAERAAARTTLGPLYSLLISPRMNARYAAAVRRFIEMTSLLFVLCTDNLHTLDHQLAYYIEWLWQEGESKSLAADTICGLQHRLNVKRCFPGSWRLFGAWSRAEVPFRAAPLPIEALFGIAGYLMSKGEFGAAALCLTGYNCILRTGECLSLARNHIVWNDDFTGGVIVLPWTKSGQRQGCSESVAFSDKVVAGVLRVACSQVGVNDRLFPDSGQRFRTLFENALGECLLVGQGFRPYSLRRGGATADFLMHMSIQNTMLRGRWMSLKACRIYVTEGQEALTRLRLSDECRRRLLYNARFLEGFV